MLVKLSLLSPITTTIVERVFFTMHIIKSRLHNKMRDGLLNDYLVTFIERDIFANINNKYIINRFKVMKNRRGSL